MTVTAGHSAQRRRKECFGHPISSQARKRNLSLAFAQTVQEMWWVFLWCLGGICRVFSGGSAVTLCAVFSLLLHGLSSCLVPDAPAGIPTSSREAVNSPWVFKNRHEVFVSDKCQCFKNRTEVRIFLWFQCYLDHVALTRNFEMFFLVKKPLLNIFFLKAEQYIIQTIIWLWCVLYLKDLHCIHLHELDAFCYWVLHELGIFRGQHAVHAVIIKLLSLNQSC